MRIFFCSFIISVAICSGANSSGYWRLYDLLLHSRKSVPFCSGIIIQRKEGVQVLETSSLNDEDGRPKGLILKEVRYRPLVFLYAQPSLTHEFGLIWHQAGMFALRFQMNREAALYFLTQAAEYNKPESQFMKAILHKEDQKYEESFLSMKKAANNRHAEAAYHLGVYYEKGIGTAKNLARAEKCYRFSGLNGNCSVVLASASALGHLLFDQGRYQAALGCFESISSYDNEPSWYARLLSALLNNPPTKKVVKFCEEIEEKLPKPKVTGNGILQKKPRQKDIEAYFGALDEKGDAKAPFCIALLHRDKNEVEKAISCFLRSAQRGYAPAQIRCGNLAMEAKKFEKAYPFFLAAAEKGYPEAMFNCAVTCEKWLEHAGKGALSEVDQMQVREKIKIWYSKAADLNFLPAIHELGMVLYHEGKFEKTFRYLSLAADNGFDASIINLGLILYSQGCYERALTYLVKMADQNNYEARYYAGLVYGFHMPTTPLNFKKAVYYLTLASEGGITEANGGLKQLFERKAQAPNIPGEGEDYELFIYPPIGDVEGNTNTKSEHNEESKSSQMNEDDQTE
ncbi:tetratricopeptide repeat protein [Candidatus Finniella inopinata]|nr:SEL1-like repeat protein [Candidatus Finniella inopinata]